MTTTLCLFSLVFLSLVVFTEADQACKVDGTVYTCPTITSTLERWGVEYRHYAPIELMGYISPASPSPVPIIGTLNTLLPNILSYFNGANANHSSIPLTRPVGIEAVHMTEYGYLAIPFMFIPSAYMGGGAPTPNDPRILPSGIVDDQSFAPIVLTFPDYPVTEDIVQQRVSDLQTILDKHGVDYIDYLWFYFSYQTADTRTYPNEIWMVPYDSNYAKQRVAQLKEMIEEGKIEQIKADY